MYFEFLEEIAIKYRIIFSTEYEDYESEIVDIMNGNINYPDTNPLLVVCKGLYYNHVNKDYRNMVKYYKIAIDLNNVDAMANLGCYYQHIEKKL